ncbi:MAG: hypothetical protein ACHQJ6_00320 [Candidatus Berkiellales bacterium]
MNIDDLTKILQTFGANPERWPAMQREEALQLINHNPEAKKLYQQSYQVDQWLDSYQVKEAPLYLQEKIVQQVKNKQTVKATRFAPLGVGLAPQVAILVICAISGFLLAQAPVILSLLEQDNAALFVQIEQSAFHQEEGISL